MTATGALPSFASLASPLSASLADPPASSVLLPAVSWLEGTLVGGLATAAAVIAVAVFGFMLLGGRVDVRRGAAVVLGCFVLFGAATIVGGLRASLAGAGPNSSAAAPPPAPLPAPPPVSTAPTPAPSVYDPHAGASVPEG